MTPEERAEKIYQFLLKPGNSIGIEDPTDFIAAEIRASVEVAKHETEKDCKARWAPMVEQDYKKGVADAYEDAAKHFACHRPCREGDYMECEGCIVARKIRALKEKP